MFRIVFFCISSCFIKQRNGNKPYLDFYLSFSKTRKKCCFCVKVLYLEFSYTPFRMKMVAAHNLLWSGYGSDFVCFSQGNGSTNFDETFLLYTRDNNQQLEYVGSAWLEECFRRRHQRLWEPTPPASPVVRLCSPWSRSRRSAACGTRTASGARSAANSWRKDLYPLCFT